MSSNIHNPLGGPAAAPYRSWFARNWKWFAPMLVVAALAAGGLFFVGVYELATNIVRSSDVYEIAIDKAERSPAVWSKIGHPFRVGKSVQGRINLTNDSGDADLSIPISGVRGKGRILVSARKRAGQWTFQTLEVRVDGQDTVIPLLGSGGGDLAPADDSV